MRGGAESDLVIETLMRFCRERADLCVMRFKTEGYLRLAHQFEIDDPGARQRMVPLPTLGASYAFRDAVTPEKISQPLVRVGPSFKIHGPRGPVTIEEDLP